MGDVTVQSTPSDTPPKAVPKTQLISVRLLVNSDGKGVPAFNQGNYHDKLPVQNADNSRTIQSSGCGLCAWTSVMAAAGCCAPVFTDVDSTNLTVPSLGAAPINPSNLLKYFSDYALSLTPPSQGLDRQPEGWADPKREAAASKFANSKIFNDTESGVLRNDSSTVMAAINKLVALNHPGTTPSFDNSQGGGGAAIGTNIGAISSALEAGNPVILAVCFDSDSNPSHQVLAVGVATIKDQTYYVINDSGFGTTDPFPALKSMGASISLTTLGGVTASAKRNGTWGYGKINTYRILGGLQSVTNLTLQPPPFVKK
jgi:hypothetical protein